MLLRILLIKNDIDIMILNEEFWVAISFLIFVMLCYKKFAKLISRNLDVRNEEIRLRVEEAKDWQKESKIKLTARKEQKANLAHEIQMIAENTALEIESIRHHGVEILKKMTAEKHVHIRDSILHLEHKFAQELNRTILSTAIKTCETIMQENLANGVSYDDSKQLIKDTIH
jgi:F0F1-type ATP synthase membrane subunit b/b'